MEYIEQPTRQFPMPQEVTVVATPTHSKVWVWIFGLLTLLAIITALYALIRASQMESKLNKLVSQYFYRYKKEQQSMMNMPSPMYRKQQVLTDQNPPKTVYANDVYSKDQYNRVSYFDPLSKSAKMHQLKKSRESYVTKQ